MTNADLPALVVRAQTGDHLAYAQLVRRFQDMAVGYAYALLGDFHLAEDAAQEAFVGAWRQLPRLREAAAFPGWFRRLVFMRCTRLRRQRRSVPALETEPASGGHPAETLEKRETSDWVLRAVDHLPQEERLATALFYIAEYSHQQIAAFLDLPAATVNNRLRAARKRLKKDLLTMTKEQLRNNAPSRDGRFAERVAKLLQPESMRTDQYQYGVEQVNGHDAWALFCACAAGDLARVRALLDRDPRLVNAQHWYQFPIHMALRQGHAEVVQLLLEAGADPGQSRFTYNSWDKLLRISAERGYRELHRLLAAAMAERFGYDAAFAPLAEAIKEGARGQVEALLGETPALVNAADTFGNSPLHWAALTRQIELIDFFIARGAALEAHRADGQTPLLVALNGDYWYRRPLPAPAQSDRWVVVRHLLACGAEYALSIACAAGDLGRVKKILQTDPAQARHLDAGGRSPLAYAAGAGHLEIVQKLLDLGAQPNQPEALCSRGGALFAASAGNHLEVAALLLERGADPNAHSDSSGCCLTIVKDKHPEACGPMQELLRQYGAFLPPYALSNAELAQAITEDGPALRDEGFLHELMDRDDPALWRLVMDQRPGLIEDLCLTDIWSGSHPTDPGVVRALVEAGLDMNRPNWIGRTFLHRAAEKGDLQTARLYLELGADLDALELEHGGTPLAAAAREGQSEMVRFLLEHGADAAAPADSPWGQPLAQAERAGQAEIAALLREHLRAKGQ